MPKVKLFLLSFQIPKKHKFGRVKAERFRQHFILQLLLVMAAFIWKTKWMLQYNGLIDVAKKPKSWNVFDNVGRVLSETALIDL